MIKLDIFTDPICPWCFIGKTHLDRALESRPNHPFTIEWHPFQLNPEMPEGGMDRRTYLEGKFGGKENAIKAYMPVAEHAEKAGLKMNLEGIKSTPNTINAHRLIHWAGIEGVQTPIVSALFKAYFIEGRDIGDIDVLADVNMGIKSVPTFIVAGQHAVPGAQPPELWQRVIDDVLEQLAQAE
ncbi:MAG: DsbA family oxidoreductase [Rhodobacteraceae bacterium]|nr:DsbA family oxidoreductase [Paracoccaceae bacterium]